MKRRAPDQERRKADEAKSLDAADKPTGLLGLFARSSEVKAEQPATADEVSADAKARYGELAPMFEELIRTSPAPSTTTAAPPADTFYGQYLDLFMPTAQATAETARNCDTSGMTAAATKVGTPALVDAQRESCRADADTGTTASTALELAKKRDHYVAIAMDAEEFVARFAGVLVEPVGDAAKTVH